MNEKKTAAEKKFSVVCFECGRRLLEKTACPYIRNHYKMQSLQVPRTHVRLIDSFAN